MSVRWSVAAALAGATALTLTAGCGDSSSTTRASVPTAHAISSARAGSGSQSPGEGPPAGSVDSCLIGRWKSVSETGTATVAGDSVNFAGGGGESITFNPDGTFIDDYAQAHPVTGNAGGHAYVLTSTGAGAGHMNAAGGRMILTFDDPNAFTTTLSQDGKTLNVDHAPSGPAATTYTCTEGHGFTSTAGGITAAYVPAQ